MIKNKRLAKNLLRVIFGIYFAIAFIATSTQIYLELVNEKSTVGDEIEELAKVFLPAISDSLWNFNHENAKAAVRGLYQTKSIVGATLKTDVTFSLGETSSDYESSSIGNDGDGEHKSSKSNERRYSSLFRYEYPIKYLEGTPDEQVIGRLYLYTSSNVVLERSKHTIVITVINSIVKTFSLWTIFYLVIGRVVARPLNELTANLKGLIDEAGHLSLKEATLFSKENHVLKRKDELGLVSNAINHLYETLYIDRQALLDYQSSLEQKVEERTAEIKRKANEIKSLLDSTPLGIMTVDEHGTIFGEHSPTAKRLLHCEEIENKSIFEKLFNYSDLDRDAVAQIRSTLFATVKEDADWYEMNASKLPSDMNVTYDKQSYFLSLVWGPVVDPEDNSVQKLLLCVKDDTELKSLRELEASQKFEAFAFKEIIEADADHLEGFLSDASENIAPVNENIESILKNTDERESTLAMLHSLKGESRTLRLSYITEGIHDLESAILAYHKESGEIAISDVKSAALNTSTIISGYIKLIEEKLGSTDSNASNKLIQIGQIIKDASVNYESLTRDESNKLLKEIDNLCHQDRMKYFLDILDSIKKSIPDMAKVCNKDTPEVHFVGENLPLSKKHFKLFNPILSHLVSNSIAHGVEEQEERINKDKTPTGNISIELNKNADKIVMRYQDDGRGLDIPRLESKIREKYSLPETEEISHQNIANFIFEPSVSTAEGTSIIAGRGFGMKSIKDELEAIGGSIELDVAGGELIDGRYLAFSVVVTIDAVSD